MDAIRSVQIFKYLSKIEKLIEAEWGKDGMNQTKMLINEKECTFSFTKKGCKSCVTKAAWNDK